MKHASPLLSLVLAALARLSAAARRARRRVPTTVTALAAVGLLAVALGQETPIPIEEGQEPFAMEVLVEGLAAPWEVTWGPDDYLWVTEREGPRITRVNPADGSTAVAVEIDDSVHIGPQHEGVLGMALHPELLQGTGNDYVYVAYTYNVGGEHELDARAKIRRYTWDEAAEQLVDPVDILTDLDAWNDHNAGRLVYGPDDKLYYSTGEQGGNQFGNFLRPINAQMLPTAAQVSPTAYEGKILRINPDGSIPADNPELNGVVTHVYSYGHRNPQGLDFGPDGTLYSVEHGPRVDDELNIIQAGGNYGWPNVAGFQDDSAYVYANWSEIDDPEGVVHDEENIPASVPQTPESAFAEEFIEPIQTFWTVDPDYDFASGCGFVCWPTIAPSSVAYYEAGENGIQAWDNSLLITTLKHGAIYRQPLAADGQSVEGDPLLYFNTQNRYRDLALSPDGRTIYVATDSSGSAAVLGGEGSTDDLANMGAILVFSYLGEDASAEEADFPSGDTGPVTGLDGRLGGEEGQDGEGAPAAPEDQGGPDDAGAPGGETAPGDEGAPGEGAPEGAPGGDAAPGGEGAPGDGGTPGDGTDQEDGAEQGGDAGAAPAGADVDVQALMPQGQEIFSSICIGCHGAEGQGGAGPALAGNEDLADAQHVLTTIHHGSGFMPPFADTYDDQQIAAVATFVRNSWGNEFGPVSPAQSAELR